MPNTQNSAISVFFVVLAMPQCPSNRDKSVSLPPNLPFGDFPKSSNGASPRKARSESHLVRFFSSEGSIYEIVSNVDDHGIGFVRLDDGLLYETRHCDDRF